MGTAILYFSALIDSPLLAVIASATHVPKLREPSHHEYPKYPGLAEYNTAMSWTESPPGSTTKGGTSYVVSLEQQSIMQILGTPLRTPLSTTRSSSETRTSLLGGWQPRSCTPFFIQP